MNSKRHEINQAFRVRGDGGRDACIAAQSVLQEHGLCGYTDWNAPEWEFLYLTHLKIDTAVRLLGDLTKHFRIRIEKDSRMLPLLPLEN